MQIFLWILVFIVYGAVSSLAWGYGIWNEMNERMRDKFSGFFDYLFNKLLKEDPIGVYFVQLAIAYIIGWVLIPVAIWLYILDNWYDRYS